MTLALSLRPQIDLPSGALYGPDMSNEVQAVYHVRADGSDDNDGSSNESGKAYLTVQAAVDAALSRPSPVPVIIRISHGSYIGGVRIAGPVPARADKDGFRLHIVGDHKSPDSVILEAIGSDAVCVSDGATVLIRGMTLRTSESGNLITATRHATVGHRSCIFGSSASETISASLFSGIIAQGPTTVSGSSMAFAHATTRSIISFSKHTITFEPGLHFARYLWAINDATVKLDMSQIIGRATGDIVVYVNGVLNVAHVHGEWGGGEEPRVFDGGLIHMGKAAVSYVAAAWKREGKFLGG